MSYIFNTGNYHILSDITILCLTLEVISVMCCVAGEVTWHEENVTLVAVKVLKEGASRETREDFKREVEIMSSFEHENILKLIGVVAIGKMVSVVSSRVN